LHRLNSSSKSGRKGPPLSTPASSTNTEAAVQRLEATENLELARLIDGFLAAPEKGYWLYPCVGGIPASSATTAAASVKTAAASATTAASAADTSAAVATGTGAASGETSAASVPEEVQSSPGESSLLLAALRSRQNQLAAAKNELGTALMEATASEDATDISLTMRATSDEGEEQVSATVILKYSIDYDRPSKVELKCPPLEAAAAEALVGELRTSLSAYNLGEGIKKAFE